VKRDRKSQIDGSSCITPSAPASILLNPDDRRIVESLRKKLGVGFSQIVRLGLRVLATKEGVTA
jgi:hypothetical protein